MVPGHVTISVKSFYQCWRDPRPEDCPPRQQRHHLGMDQGYCRQ